MGILSTADSCREHFSVKFLSFLEVIEAKL